jgi:hypothetical protein
MQTEFFKGFTPDEKREVAQALNQVKAIREAYTEVTSLAAQAQSASLAESNNGVVAKERGEAVAAAGAGAAALMTELADYTDKIAMSPASRAGAVRFVQQLVLARAGDAEALAKVQGAKNELGEANRARADFGVDPRGARPTIEAGDRALEDATRTAYGAEATARSRNPDSDETWAAKEARKAAEFAAMQADQRGVVEVVAKGAVNTTALPDSFKDRYIKAGDLIVDAHSPARMVLVDKGRRLDAPAEFSSETVAAMVDVAQARRWSSVAVKGSAEFRAAVYMEAASRGVAVTGYSPSPAEQAVAAATHQRAQQHAEQARARDEQRAQEATRKAQDAASVAARSPAVVSAFHAARSPQERQEAIRQHPELRTAFALEGVAAAAAKAITPYPARQAFMSKIRESISQDLAAGKPLPDVQLRRRELRDRDASQGQAR